MKEKKTIIMFLLSIIIINVSDYIIRKVQKQNMYQAEIKGIVWDIFLKEEETITIIIEIIKETILWMNIFSMTNPQIL